MLENFEKYAIIYLSKPKHSKLADSSSIGGFFCARLGYIDDY